MIRDCVRCAAVALLVGFVASPAGAAVSSDIQKLTMRRSVTVIPPAADERLRETDHPTALIAEDSLLAAGAAPEFTDVRLMDEEGRAVKMTRLEPRRIDVITTHWRSIPLAWSEGPDRGRQMVIDLGDDRPADLVVDIVGPMASRSIRLSGSDDGVEWGYLPLESDNGPPPSKDPAVPAMRLSPAETKRWIRLEQDEGFPAPSTSDRVELVRRMEVETPREAVGIRATSRFGAAGSTSNWSAILELTGPPRAILRLDLESMTPTGGPTSFSVDIRLPRGGWQSVSIERTPDWQGGRRDSILITPTRTNAIRLIVFGADPPNEPLRVIGVVATPARWEFEATPEKRWLGWGDRFAVNVGEATTPAYPWGNGVIETSIRPLRTELGPQEPNPFHREPGFGLEWLRRRPVVLSVVMLAILALALLLARRPRPAA